LDILLTDIRSLSVVSLDKSEENKKIHEKVEAMTDIAHPKHDLWLHRPKAVVMRSLSIGWRRRITTLISSMLISRWFGKLCFLWTKHPKLYLPCSPDSSLPKGFASWCGKNSWLVLSLPLLRYWRAIRL
jgi:hypothetical protein